MNIGQAVNTENGEGVIVDIRPAVIRGGLSRIGVMLAKSPYSFNPAYYLSLDVKPVTKNH